MFKQLSGNIDLGRELEHAYLQVVLPQFFNSVYRLPSLSHTAPQKPVTTAFQRSQDLLGEASDIRHQAVETNTF